jgi:elongation factor Ts
MAIDAKLIKTLRDETGMGITDCKKALEEAGGDLDQAEMLLRKRQKEKAIKKADRATGQGAVAVETGDQAALMVEVACEQEPTVSNERFAAFLNLALEKGLASGAASAEELLAVETADGTLADSLTALAGTVGENVQLRRAARVETPPGGVLGAYVHFNKKAGAVCALKLDGADAGSPELQTAARDICMHAVATRPAAVTREAIPDEEIAKEKEIFQEEVKDKPENIQEKILHGKLGKFYKEKVLLEQVFVKDPEGKQTVEKMLEAAAKQAGGTAEIAGFARFELGQA